MPLALDPRNLLPPGVHDATLEEVEVCLTRFPAAGRRRELFAKLRAYVEELRKAKCGIYLVIDGSFVMAGVDEPDDIRCGAGVARRLGHGGGLEAVSIQSGLEKPCAAAL